MGATSILDRANIEDALTGFKTGFDMAFENATTITERIAMRVQSDSPIETYNWFGPTPMMEEWIGDRILSELRAYAMTIENKDWANGLRIKANDIRDDKLGMIMPRIQRLGGMAGRHQEKLVIEKLLAGFTTTGYDGQFFFDTDHVDGNGSAQSNKGTAALDATSYNAAWTAMMSLTDENGEPLAMGMQPTLLVGPKLRSTARQLLEAEVLSSGATNTDAGTADLIVSPRLVGTYDDYWFLLFSGDGGMRPIILQEKEPVEFIQQFDPDSEGYFNRKEYRAGANWRGNVGYAWWQLAYGAIVA
jgi:phage major head subunit gpT-like protein